MKTSIYLLAALILGTAALVALHRVCAAGGIPARSSASPRPELEYRKAVNGVAPPKDPQVLFLLMAEYSNPNLLGEGAEFLSARLQEFGPQLSHPQKALYLSAIGLVRAQHARSVPLLHRAGYVKVYTQKYAHGRMQESAVGK